MESMKDYEDEINRSFRKINEGDIISGTVISCNEEEVILDLNYYTQGIIKAENLSNEPGFSIVENIKLGDTVEATVIRVDDGRGNIELSKKEANDVLAWDKLKELMDNETIVSVKIKEAVNKGVVAYLEGIRGFIPASQLASTFVEDTEGWVGKTVDVKVITVEQDNEKLVLSGKKVALEREADERNHKISALVPGTVLEGTVETIAAYGAFVNIGDGLSGLVHISQISQKRINSPYEVLKEGQKVKVKILNTNDGKVSLSMKALEEEMIEEESSVDVEAYNSNEEVTTSLGSLLAGFLK